MDIPPELESIADHQKDIAVTTRSYDDDETVISVDFGPDAGQPSLDILGDTAIVVIDSTQLEFEVPNDAENITMNDSILTIRAGSRGG